MVGYAYYIPLFSFDIHGYETNIHDQQRNILGYIYGIPGHHRYILRYGPLGKGYYSLGKRYYSSGEGYGLSGKGYINDIPPPRASIH